MTDLFGLFLAFVNLSISASWLVLAVLLLRLLLRKAPKWLNPILWGLVGLRLVLPFSIESVLSLIPRREAISPETLYDRTPVAPGGTTVIPQSPTPIPGSSGTVLETPAEPAQNWLPLLAVIWIAGVVLLLGYLVFSYLRLSGHVRTAVRLRENLYQSERVTCPFVFGLIRPRIYLPFGMPEQELAHVIAHERAHIRRRDHWIKPLGFLLLSLYWFNPLLWVAYVLLCRDIELACDERVIRKLNEEERADYSEALLACSVSRRMISACPLAFGEVGVKARVKNVLHYKKPAFWLIVVAVLSCIVVAVCFLTDPKEADLPDPTGKVYGIAEYRYDSTVYSFTYIPNEIPTRYFAVTGKSLYVKNDLLAPRSILGEDEWVTLDGLTEIELTPENFDAYLPRRDVAGWHNEGDSAEHYRRENARAWRVIHDRYMYYLLLQKDGSVYLACGYYDSDSKTDPASDDSKMRYLFLLEETAESTGLLAVSGQNTVPVVVTEAGTSVAEIRDALHWLVIAPGAEDTVPFRILIDGEEQRGLYSIFDAETLEPLDFFRPSGLDPQTYLFRNAEYGRDYIVTLRTDPMGDGSGDLLCFGAHLPAEGSSFGSEPLADARLMAYKPEYYYTSEGYVEGSPIAVSIRIPFEWKASESDRSLYMRSGDDSAALALRALTKVDADFVLDKAVYQTSLDPSPSSLGDLSKLEYYDVRIDTGDNGCRYVLYDRYSGNDYYAYAFVRLNADYVIQLSFDLPAEEDIYAVSILNSISPIEVVPTTTKDIIYIPDRYLDGFYNYSKEVSEAPVAIGMMIPDTWVTLDDTPLASIYLGYSPEIPVMEFYSLHKVGADFVLDENVHLSTPHEMDIVGGGVPSLKNYDVRIGTSSGGCKYVLYESIDNYYEAYAFVRLNAEYVIEIEFYLPALDSEDALNALNSICLTETGYIMREINYSPNGYLNGFYNKTERVAGFPVTIGMNVPAGWREEPAGSGYWRYIPGGGGATAMGFHALSKVDADFVLDKNVHLNTPHEMDAEDSEMPSLKNYTVRTGTSDRGCEYVLYDRYSEDDYYAFAFVRLNAEYVIEIEFWTMEQDSEDVLNVLNSIYVK